MVCWAGRSGVSVGWRELLGDMAKMGEMLKEGLAKGAEALEAERRAYDQTRSEAREVFLTGSSPSRISARIAVGAV